MKRWLSLLRSKNLLIVAATQSVVWWALPAGNLLHRILLVLSTVCITAGGYLINDWYDVEIDAINKPQKAFLQDAAQQKTAKKTWVFLSVLGILLAIPPAVRMGMPALLFLQILTVLLLWWYAARGKRLPVIGNVLVALLTALSMELPQFYVWDSGRVGAAIDLLAGFAFLLTWMREIVKDLQDEAGDRAGSCKTLPLVAGRRAAVRMASALGGIVLLAVLWAAAVLAVSPLGYIAAGLIFGVAVPLIVWMQRLWQSHTPAAYGRSSSLLKGVMLAGLLLFAGAVFISNTYF